MQTLMTGGPSRTLLLLAFSGLVLSACDENSTNKGERCVSSLGIDFVRAFSQDRDAEPLDASELELELTPQREPFDVPC